jgi:hypothetical protein
MPSVGFEPTIQVSVQPQAHALNRTYDLYCSINIIQVIKSRRIRWVGHVARMGDRRGAYRALVGRPEHLEDLGVILEWIFKT